MRAYLTCGLCLLVLAANSRSQAGPSADSARALLTEGKQLYIQEGPKAALLKFERALDIFHSNKERQGEAITLGYIANCQRKLGNLDQALEYAQKALHMKEELGD